MSTTASEEVATGYSKGSANAPRSVFAADMSAVSRGAFLGWISQYPDEVEFSRWSSAGGVQLKKEKPASALHPIIAPPALPSSEAANHMTFRAAACAAAPYSVSTSPTAATRIESSWACMSPISAIRMSNSNPSFELNSPSAV